MTNLPRNLPAALESMDRAARSISQAGNDLRDAHLALGNVPEMTGRMLDLYIDIDRLHDRVRSLLADAGTQAA